ncbi:MAG TPA: hypothetical protein VGS28_03260 [Candidatus Saccharimonadales bacterium]|nr:hypothetical protein [Candidatus Saccharimonadales bacterium]
MVDTATAATLPTSGPEDNLDHTRIDEELAALEASLLHETDQQTGPDREQLPAEPTDPAQAWTQMHSPAFIARPEVVPDPREIYRQQLLAVIGHDSNVVVNTLRREHLDRAA